MPERDPILTRLETEAQAQGVPIIGPLSGSLIQLLARLAQPELIVELGTATGYSGIWLLRSWSGARLISFEIDPSRAAAARSNFAAAGFTERSEVMVENAIEGLARLPAQSAGIVFNDVLNGLRNEDRVDECFRLALMVLKPDGLLLADNALGIGDDPRRESNQARCVRRWNELVKQESSLTSVIVPVGDGLSVAVKA
jgi:predicted O-methyltransferase YrrM